MHKKLTIKSSSDKPKGQIQSSQQNKSSLDPVGLPIQKIRTGEFSDTYFALQLKPLLGVVGNQSVQRLIREHRIASHPNIIQHAQDRRRRWEHTENERDTVASEPEREIERFQGYNLSTDENQLEKVLRAVIAQKGFGGAASFILDYNIPGFSGERQRELRNKITPLLWKKFRELHNLAKSYTETTFRIYLIGYLDQILNESEKVVNEEARKYGVNFENSWSMLGGSENLTELTTAAKDILAHHAVLEQLTEKQKGYEEAEPIYESQPPDVFSPFSNLIKITGYNTRITNQAAHARVAEEILAAQQSYQQARALQETRFPILASFRPPDGLDKLKAIAEGGAAERSLVINFDLLQKRQNIEQIRVAGQYDRFIWRQPSIVAGAKKVAGVQPGSIEDRGINKKIEQVESSDFYHKLGLGLLSLMGALLAAVPTGGGSLAAYAAVGAGVGASLSAGAISIYEDIQEYQVQKAATGTVFDKALAISQQEPSLFWLAFSIVSNIADVGDAFKAFSRAARAIHTAEKAATHQETARKIYAQSGLGGVLNEKEYVAMYVRHMAEQANLASPVASFRSALLEELATGRYQEMPALLAGDETALLRLLKSHGKWEGLLMGLTSAAATPEMRKIGKSLAEYRTRELVERLKFRYNASLLPGSGEKDTSDLDFSFKTDETGEGYGAGRKLMEAETEMIGKFGKGWEDMWRVNFYTDIESRLLATEQVLDLMSPWEKAILKYKQHQLSTKFNLARQLQYAASDPQAISLIEKQITELGFDVKEIRQLSDIGEDAARFERNKLLLQIDEKELALRTATGERKVRLAREIQELQMEANFYTREAVISPGAGKELLSSGSAQGTEIVDAIMEWKTMLMHNIAEYGSVAEAMRHYEAWKYIKRQCEFALRTDLDPSIHSRLESFMDRGWYKYEEREFQAIGSSSWGSKLYDEKNVEVYNEFLGMIDEIIKNQTKK